MERKKREWTRILPHIFLFALALLSGFFLSRKAMQSIRSSDSSSLLSKLEIPSPTPWNSIGGCGAGGGGGGGASYMWVGQGVSGGWLDVEARVSRSMVAATGWGTVSSETFAIPLTLTLNPGRFTLSASMPFQLKSRVNKENGSLSTAGIGDLALTLNKTIGSTGNFAMNIGLTFPFGKYDVHDNTGEHALVTSDLQLGTGLWGGSAGFDYTVDRDWGLMIFGAGFSGAIFPFIMFRTETTEWEKYDNELLRAAPKKRTLGCAIKLPEEIISQESDPVTGKAYFKTDKSGIGMENDYGLMTPFNIDVHWYIGWKGKRITKSLGLVASIPTGNGWSHSTIYYPITDDNSAARQFTSLDAAQAYVDTVKRINTEAMVSTPYELVRTRDGYLVSAGDTSTQQFGTYSHLGPFDSTGIEQNLYWEPVSTDYKVVTTGDYYYSNSDTTMNAYYIRKREKKIQKSWVTLTPGVGMEIHNRRIPLFWSFTLPVEFNLDDGIGIKGFSFDVGVKFIAF